MSGKKFMPSTYQPKKILQGNEANLHNMWIELIEGKNHVPLQSGNFSFIIIMTFFNQRSPQRLQWLELTVSSNVTLLIPQIPPIFNFHIKEFLIYLDRLLIVWGILSN